MNLTRHSERGRKTQMLVRREGRGAADEWVVMGGENGNRKNGERRRVLLRTDGVSRF